MAVSARGGWCWVGSAAALLLSKYAASTSGRRSSTFRLGKKSSGRRVVVLTPYDEGLGSDLLARQGGIWHCRVRGVATGEMLRTAPLVEAE